MKASAMNSMLLTIASPEIIETFVISLCDVNLEADGDEYILEVCYKPKKQLPFKANVVLSITTDPHMTQAGGWMNMGHTRIKYTLFKATLQHTSNTIKYKGKLVERDYIFPERHVNETVTPPLAF